jgi:hypothetical protein
MYPYLLSLPVSDNEDVDEVTKLSPNWMSSTQDSDNRSSTSKGTGTGGPVFSRPEILEYNVKTLHI